MPLTDTLIEFDNTTFRNIIYSPTKEQSVFDDLSDNLEDQKIANDLSLESADNRFSSHDLQYQAIDFIFNQKTWLPSRFSTGQFPTWYGSLDFDTSVHETVFHWRKTLLSDAGFLNLNEPIISKRTVFNVDCTGMLLDIRKKATSFPHIIGHTPQDYRESQKIGAKMRGEGLNGLLTLSARKKEGQNVVVFKKNILNNALLHQDITYIIEPRENKIKVLNSSNNTIMIL